MDKHNRLLSVVKAFNMMKFLDLRIGMELLSIRSSDIAFTMGQKDRYWIKQRTMTEILRYFKISLQSTEQEKHE